LKRPSNVFLSLLVLLITLAGCASGSASKWNDGSYEGSAKGLYGDIVMSVQIDKGKILSIEVVEHSESPGITDAAFDRIPKSIVEKQGVDGIDTMAGATVTSDAIIEAVTNALKKAEK
jgi:urocanate reductase